ncbi:MAG: hypothetical protein KAT34_18190 [Candidatus Aminicenantes bacterium]|nr:hypothetical protein [Candidatus Aminicenantes bacterium]
MIFGKCEVTTSNLTKEAGYFKISPEIDMKYYYVAAEQYGNRIAEEGIQCDESGVITVITLKDTFLMDKFVLDVYTCEVLGLEEYSLFEISLKGIAGELLDSNIDNLFSEFFQVLTQPFISPGFLKRITTYRYEGMGLDIGLHIVENKEKFDDEYKKKILGYYHEIE